MGESLHWVGGLGCVYMQRGGVGGLPVGRVGLLEYCAVLSGAKEFHI